MVKDCGTSLQLKRIGPGRYTIGDSDKNIFVRILRSVRVHLRSPAQAFQHIVVRVGGGWDSLKNYLLTHKK